MKKGAWANIPPKSNRIDPICFSPYLYRARNQVERFFNRIKQCRRVATRYDKLAANNLAFVQLALSGYGSVLMSPRPNYCSDVDHRKITDRMVSRACCAELRVGRGRLAPRPST